MSSVFQIYYDHWGREQNQRRKYAWLFHYGWKETMKKTFLFWQDTIGLTCRNLTHPQMIQYLKISLPANLADILSFYSRYDDENRVVEVKMDFLKHFAHHLFPDVVSDGSNDDQDFSSPYYEINRIRKRLRRNQPTASFKNPLFFQDVDRLRTLEAIIA